MITKNSIFSKTIGKPLRSVVSTPLFSKLFNALRQQSKDDNLQSPSQFIRQATEWGYCDKAWTGSPKILIAAGHGYGNVGDEAQLAACILRWKSVAATPRLVLLSPNPAFTSALHKENCAWAPRVTWFLANTKPTYFTKKSIEFRTFFFFVSIRLIFTAYMIRLGLPLLICVPREVDTINQILASDIVHISGGGYLTGLTESRLWENALLMRICKILRVPYMLTGHNIGVFKDNLDRLVAKMGLSNAFYIGLRDKGLSEKELMRIGITGPHIHSTCDDALICETFGHQETLDIVASSGADPSVPWVAINFHYWGMNEMTRESAIERFSQLCDYISSRHGLTCLFIAMVSSDQEACLEIGKRMTHQSHLVPYSPDYRVTRSVIKHASFCFTLKHHPIVFAIGENTPVVSVSLDSYYELKNKGALANIDNERFALGLNEFLSAQAELAIDYSLANATIFERTARVYVDKQSSISLDPYLQALNLLSSS